MCTFMRFTFGKHRISITNIYVFFFKVLVSFIFMLQPLTSEEYTFMVTYIAAMIMQIFVPGWLGTQISYEVRILGPSDDIFV